MADDETRRSEEPLGPPPPDTREAEELTEPISTPEELLSRAHRLLRRGDAEAAEAVLWQTFRAAHDRGDLDREIEATALLGELLVTQRNTEAGARVLRHCRQLIDSVSERRRQRYAQQRRLVERYLAELEPIDPRFVEWAD